MGEHDRNPLEDQSFASTRRRAFLCGAAGACFLSGIGTGIGASGEGDEGAESSGGEELWRVDFDNSDFLRGPALSSVEDGTLFVSNPDAVHALSASTGNEEWQFSVDDTRFHNRPIVVDGTVFAMTNDSYGREVGDGKGTSVYALDADTGEQKWQFDEYENTVAPIHVAEDTVFIPSQFCVYAVDAATGEQRWQFKVGYGVETNPRTDFFAETATGTLYVADIEGNVFAVDVATGEEKWRVDTGIRVTTELTVVDDTLFLGAIRSKSGSPTNFDLQYYVSALDAATGDERWRFTLNPEPGLERPTLEFVTVIGDTLFAGSDSCANYPTCSSLYAVDAASGEEKWQFEADNSVDTVTEADGTLFVGTALGRGDDGVVHAVDPETGTELWSYLAGNLLVSPITVVEDTLFVSSRTDTDFEDAYRLNALDTATGDEKWNFIADTDVSEPRFADGAVFVSADYTTVHALDTGVEGSSEDTKTDGDSSEDTKTDGDSSEDTGTDDESTGGTENETGGAENETDC